MNGEIKVAVCDDLEEDRQVLVNLLSEYTDKNNLYVKIQEFTSGEAFLASDTSEYSLVFMDIFMDGINGMETAKALIVRNSRVQIVFESTSTEFAAEAFDIEALHYLVKPDEKRKAFRNPGPLFRQRLLPEDCERESRTAGREHLSFRHPLCGGRWKTGKSPHQKRRDGGIHVCCRA